MLRFKEDKLNDVNKLFLGTLNSEWQILAYKNQRNIADIVMRRFKSLPKI